MYVLEVLTKLLEARKTFFRFNKKNSIVFVVSSDTNTLYSEEGVDKLITASPIAWANPKKRLDM